MAATLLRMPVSATHSIVGATVGFALVALGTRGINWGKLAMISKYFWSLTSHHTHTRDFLSFVRTGEKSFVE